MVAHFPVALRLNGRVCLVVGGGMVALRKVQGLLECGAHIRVVAPEIIEELQQLVTAGQVNWVRREFSDGDIEEAFLIIAATNERELNARVGRLADQACRLVNVVDQLEDCNCILPAVHRAGALNIAVTTDGKSPALAVRIKHELANQYPENVYRLVLEWLGELRNFILAHEIDPARRRELLLDLGKLDLPHLVRVGQVEEALQLLEKMVREYAASDELMLRLRDKINLSETL